MAWATCPAGHDFFNRALACSNVFTYRYPAVPSSGNTLCGCAAVLAGMGKVIFLRHVGGVSNGCLQQLIVLGQRASRCKWVGAANCSGSAQGFQALHHLSLNA